MNELTRINKRMSELGLCSRREADTLIDKGAVLVNGQKAVMGQKVASADTITLTGKKPAKKQYLAYYKGRGVITHSPAAGETDIATRLKKDYKLTGIYPVGRLDKDSEGLMILTDDGRVTGPLLDPDSNNTKIYEVFLDKPVTGAFLKQMEAGVNIEGYHTKTTTVDKKTPKRIHLSLTEGKKHQIRRMCAALGYQVQSLKRLQILNVELGTLKPNQYRKISGEELQTFLETLGIK